MWVDPNRLCIIAISATSTGYRKCTSKLIPDAAFYKLIIKSTQNFIRFLDEPLPYETPSSIYSFETSWRIDELMHGPGEKSIMIYTQKYSISDPSDLF